MKTTRLLPLLGLLVLLALLSPGRAQALEMKVGRVNPFVDNEITVVSDVPGLLTIRVDGRLDAVTALPVEAGTTVIPWRALSWHDEPLPQLKVTLTAELTPAEGPVQTARAEADVRLPRCAVLYCLPEHNRYVIGGEPLQVEVGVSAKGKVRVEVVPAGEKAKRGKAVWAWEQTIPAGNSEHILVWNWKRPKARLTPGDYEVRAWSLVCPWKVCSFPLTLTKEDDTPEDLFLTGPVLPEDLTDDEAVWAALTAPVVVGAGGEGAGLRLYAEPDTKADRIGAVSCATVCLTVLDLSVDKWAKVGAWKQIGGEYVEGWVPRSRLRIDTPNTRYGVVVDKNTQIMKVYEAGRCIGSVTVSTGYQITGKYLTNSETRAGAYLVGKRWTRFVDKGYTYQYPIRIDGKNLIHQMGWRTKLGIPDGFAEQRAQLGTKASHGCVRVDCLPAEGGINAYWLWTHLAHNTKVLVIDDPAARHARLDELGIPY